MSELGSPGSESPPQGWFRTILYSIGDAVITPVTTTLKHFRHEYEAHIREGRCPLVADWRAGQPVGGH